jgi:predicted flap endonuclease-1-like 5' DNA nuclease
MSIDRNGRVVAASGLFLVALLLASGNAINGAALLDYALPFVLTLLALAILFLQVPTRRPAVVGGTFNAEADAGLAEPPTEARPYREFLPPAVDAIPTEIAPSVAHVEVPVTPAMAEVVDAVTEAPAVGEGQQDLLAIDGIGPKAQAALYASGIHTFANLAATSTERLREIMAEQKVRVIGSSIETWARQARFIVDRDYPGLMRYIAELKRTSSE